MTNTIAELFYTAFSPVNIFLSILLIFVLIYWVFVAIGAANTESLDFDFDIDADLDLDLDVDADIDVEAGEIGSSEVSVPAYIGFLQFFNVGKVPVILILSFLVVFMWTISMVLNDLLNNQSLLISFLLMIPNFIVSLFITKLVSSPFAKMFGFLNKTSGTLKLNGRICTIRVPVKDGNFGQAQVEYDQNNLLISIKCINDDFIPRDSKALIIEQSEDKSYYLVEKYEN